MKYLRLSETTNLSVVGSYPQNKGMVSALSVDDPRHLMQCDEFGIIPPGTYLPELVLDTKAKWTDLLSFSIKNCFIVSERLKAVVERADVTNVQFLKIAVVSDAERRSYYLMRFTAYDHSLINFRSTDINVMRSTWEVDHSMRVSDIEEFEVLVDKTTLPFSIAIPAPVFVTGRIEKMFALKYVYYGFQCFLSPQFAEEMTKAGLTGIEFRELEDQ